MRLLTANFKEAEAYRGTEPYAVISITDPSEAPAKLREGAPCCGILRIAFSDVDERFPKKYKRITNAQATQIVRFVTQHVHVKTLLIHCGAGISRSRGVALALADAFGWHYETPIYNAYVHRKVYAAAMVQKRKTTDLG